MKLQEQTNIITLDYNTELIFLGAHITDVVSGSKADIVLRSRRAIIDLDQMEVCISVKNGSDFTNPIKHKILKAENVNNGIFCQLEDNNPGSESTLLFTDYFLRFESRTKFSFFSMILQ